ncbi:hypothetical protein IPL68_05305 [Candidatus Saccharibacteria bacterium]|nr:MAG: hypothetical protein IPL68_05305 [Candidatus Saccharibacteria bacterium]
MIANPEVETPGTTPAGATVDKPEQTAAVSPSSPQVEVPVNIVAADTHTATEQQTSAAEEASVESQIAAFANNQTTSSVSPLPQSTDSQSVTDSNEAALTEAVEDLAAAVNEPPAMILPPSQKTVPGEETTTVTNAEVQEPTNVTPSVSPSTEAVVENAAAASPPVLPTDTVPQSASPESVATRRPLLQMNQTRST